MFVHCYEPTRESSWLETGRIWPARHPKRDDSVLTVDRADLYSAGGCAEGPHGRETLPDCLKIVLKGDFESNLSQGGAFEGTIFVYIIQQTSTQHIQLTSNADSKT